MWVLPSTSEEFCDKKCLFVSPVQYNRTVVEKEILEPGPKLELNKEQSLNDQLEADKANKERVPNELRIDEYKE